MGLPADTLLKPEAKDMTLFEKGRHVGYQEAIRDVLGIINHVTPDPWEVTEWAKSRIETCELLEKRVKELTEGKE